MQKLVSLISAVATRNETSQQHWRSSGTQQPFLLSSSAKRGSSWRAWRRRLGKPKKLRGRWREGAKRRGTG